MVSTLPSRPQAPAANELQLRQASTAKPPRQEAKVRRRLTALLPCLFVFLAACLMFFGNLGDYPLFNPDESLYAEPAREMLDTGEYITTLLNYVVRFTKPPLVIWAMALSYNIFGVTEFAARFLGAACGAVLVAVTYLFVERYASRRAAVIAAFSLVAAPLFIGTAREAITDMPLSLFTAGALMAFYHGFRQNIGYWRWVGYVLVGLAVMTKGPVGLILPVVIMGAFHLLRGQLRAAWRFYNPIAGLLVVAAIAVPWFATEIYVTKGAYFQEFLVRENFQRFTSVVDHKGAWWYHIAAIAGGYFPWSLFVPAAVWAAIVGRPLMENRGNIYSGGSSDLKGFLLFNVLTFVTILGFFSVSVSKLLPYTLPAFPALAALVGVYLDREIARRKAFSLMAVMLLIAVAGAVALYVVPIAIVRLREMPPSLPVIIQQSLLCLIAASAAGALGAYIKRPQLALCLFSSVLFVCFLVSGKRALDVLSSEWEGPVPAFSRFAALSGEPIVVWHMRKPSITFYAGRRVIIPLDAEQLHQTIDSAPKAYVIAKVADLPAFADMPQCKLLVTEGRFALLRKQAH